MNIGIIGLPHTGRKTLFDLLVGGAREKQKDPKKPSRGVAEVQDGRFDRLVEIYRPPKSTRARIEIVLPGPIEGRAISHGDILRDLGELDAFCHVVRAFENDAVYHVSGSVDPVRDIDYVGTEFILHDLLFIEKRIERIEKDLTKHKVEGALQEKELLLKMKAWAESERPLRLLELTRDEERSIRSYPFLTTKDMIVVLNVNEAALGTAKTIDDLKERYRDADIAFLQIAVKMESEIGALESEEERAQFMKELGIAESALRMLTRSSIDALGLVSFFTVAGDELRQWFVRRGATALEAAGKIHTDLARGFIRAEVIRFEDLEKLGSEEKVKSAGKLGVKGKDYVVEDGDILFIRFSV